MSKKYLAFAILTLIGFFIAGVIVTSVLRSRHAVNDMIPHESEIATSTLKLQGQIYKVKLHEGSSTAAVPVLHLATPISWRDDQKKVQYIKITSSKNLDNFIGSQVTVTGSLYEKGDDTSTPWLAINIESIEPLSDVPKDIQLTDENRIGKIYSGDCGASSLIVFDLAEQQSVSLGYTDPLDKTSPNVEYKKWNDSATRIFYPFINPDGQYVWDDGGRAFDLGCSGQLSDSVLGLDEYQKELIKKYFYQVSSPQKEQIIKLHPDIETLLK
jgi:hypothetical protein